MSKKCPICKSTDVTEHTPGIFGDSRHRCNSCGEINFTANFIEPTLFDRITQSREVLAEKLVYKTLVVGNNRVTYSCWRSTITEESYRTKKEAIVATLEKLKEVK